MIEITVICSRCNKKQPTIRIMHRQLKSWVNGEKIQVAMPGLTPAERELLISATCDTCFNEMFAPEGE